jgi:HPt (histidine-containing phosphotransfer) domain-containing protein
LWSPERRAEIAEHARELSGSSGATGVSRLMAMAHWLQDRDRK